MKMPTLRPHLGHTIANDEKTDSLLIHTGFTLHQVTHIDRGILQTHREDRIADAKEHNIETLMDMVYHGVSEELRNLQDIIWAINPSNPEGMAAQSQALTHIGAMIGAMI